MQLIVDHAPAKHELNVKTKQPPFFLAVPGPLNMHHKHKAGGSDPDAQFLCSAILSSFPRQMSRQTLHINTNPNTRPFPPARCQQLLSKQYTTTQ